MNTVCKTQVASYIYKIYDEMMVWITFRTPKPSVAGSDDGEEKDEEDDEDEASVMTIDGVEGGYARFVILICSIDNFTLIS